MELGIITVNLELKKDIHSKKVNINFLIAIKKVITELFCRFQKEFYVKEDYYEQSYQNLG